MVVRYKKPSLATSIKVLALSARTALSVLLVLPPMNERGGLLVEVDTGDFERQVGGRRRFEFSCFVCPGITFVEFAGEVPRRFVGADRSGGNNDDGECQKTNLATSTWGIPWETLDLESWPVPQVRIEIICRDQGDIPFSPSSVACRIGKSMRDTSDLAIARRRATMAPYDCKTENRWPAACKEGPQRR